MKNINKVILFILNIAIIMVPYAFMNYLKNAVTVNLGVKPLDSPIYLIVAGVFIINTLILKHGMFMGLQNKNNPQPTASSVAVQRLCVLSSSLTFAVTIVASIAFLLQEQHFKIIPLIMILCTISCIIIGNFSAFLKYVIKQNNTFYR